MATRTIYCAHCGAGGQRPDAYCTRCGGWLADPAALGRGRRFRRRSRSPEQRQRLFMILNALDAALALAAAVMMLTLTRGPRDAGPAAPLSAAFCLIISAHQIVSFVHNLGEWRRHRRASAAETQAASSRIDGSSPPPRELGTGRLEEFPPAFGVTEGTTELLERSPRARGEGRR